MNQRGDDSPMIYQDGTPVTEVILHTTATAKGWYANRSVEEKRNEIDRWHRDRRFRMIGYHYVVDRDGTVAKGRDEDDPGAHVKGHNHGTIGIALVGGLGGKSNDPFSDNYTSEQRQAVWKLLRDIAKRTDLRKVTGHNDYTNLKECPCFLAAEEFPWPPAFSDEGKPSILQSIIEFLINLLRRKR